MYINTGSDRAAALERMAKAMRKMSTSFKPTNYGEQRERWLDKASKGGYTIPVFRYDREKILSTTAHLEELSQLKEECKDLFGAEALKAARPGTNLPLLEWTLGLISARADALIKPMKSRLEWLREVPEEGEPASVFPHGAPSSGCSLAPRKTYEAEPPSEEELRRWQRVCKYYDSTPENEGLFTPVFSDEEVARAKQQTLTASEAAEIFNQLLQAADYRDYCGKLWRAEGSL